MNDKILSLFSLSAKAGKIKSGEVAVENAVKEGKALLVVVAGDASDNTKKKYRNMCTYYHTPIHTYATKESIAKSIGKEYTAAVAVCDEGFAKGLMKQFAALDI